MTNHEDHTGHDHHSDPGDAAREHKAGCCGGPKADARGTVKDPVCGMDVDPQTTPHHAVHGGNDYHFCSAGCRAKFIADPEAYLTSAVRPEISATPGTMWTCP